MMQVIFKNSKILFQNKEYRKLDATSTLNTPTSFYVTSKRVAYGGNGGGERLYVDIFAVTAGVEYTIRSAEGWTPGDAGLTGDQQICFGTNLLTGSGNITNAVVIKTFNSQAAAYSLTFTPASNGYVYVTQYNYTAVPAICISEVYY